jgi:hypothetical protein
MVVQELPSNVVIASNAVHVSLAQMVKKMQLPTVTAKVPKTAVEMMEEQLPKASSQANDAAKVQSQLQVLQGLLQVQGTDEDTAATLQSRKEALEAKLMKLKEGNLGQEYEQAALEKLKGDLNLKEKGRLQVLQKHRDTNKARKEEAASIIQKAREDIDALEKAYNEVEAEHAIQWECHNDKNTKRNTEVEKLLEGRILQCAMAPKKATETVGQEKKDSAPVTVTAPALVSTTCSAAFNAVSDKAEVESLPDYEPDAAQMISCSKMHYVLQQWEIGGCMHYFTFAQLNEWCETKEVLPLVKELLGPTWELWFGEQTTEETVLPRQAVIFTARATSSLKSNYDASKLADNATQAKVHYAAMKQRCHSDANPY